MKQNHLFFLFLPLLVYANLFSFGQAEKSPQDLHPGYRKWLEEEVVYIITPKEKEVFLQLESDRERNVFIDAFWRQRDPVPETPANEFKDEHEKRIQYANQWLGKESPGPGWRSDMGRIHIILGEPKSIERYENIPNVYPVIVWHYAGLTQYGLPNSFNVAFFKRYGMGEYELYSPIKFGPQHLLSHYEGDQTDYMSAYYVLQNNEPGVADISLSLIPGESRELLAPSLASEILVAQKIPAAPFEVVKDSYAEKLLKYKDIVEVEYSANFIENDSLVRVIQDDSGLFFVHYLVEPQKLSFVEYQGRYNSNLAINGSIADLSGKTVYQFERTIPIEFDESQIASIQNKLFSFQDMFPLVPGDYRFNLLLKNTVAKEFTSVEAGITIPETPSLRLSPLILANRLSKGSAYKGKNKPFLIGDLQLLPSPRNDFSKKDILYLYVQVQGLTDEIKKSGTLVYSILSDTGIVLSLNRSLNEYPDPSNIFEEFSLADIPAAYYRLKVSLLNGDQEEILFEQNPFYVTPLESLPRPWLISMPMPPSNDPSIANTLGNQLYNKQELPKALPLLEAAYHSNPQSVNFSLDFGRALFATKDYQRVKQIAQPFLEDERKYPFLQLLGESCQALGELDGAIAYYKEYLAYYGTHLPILNSIGSCYYQLGNIEEALIAWERSLAIAEQEELRAKVKSLKERK